MTVNFVKIFLGLVYVIVTTVNAAPSNKLPKGFIQCKLSDPKINECLRDAGQKAVPHLAKGIPSLGINKIDPLRITTLEIQQGSGPVNLKLDLKEIDIINIKHVLIDKVQFDPVKFNIYIEMRNPKPILLDGNYETNGKVLILPIVGKGKCKISLEVSKIVCNILLKKVVKKGDTYLEIVNIKWNFMPTKLQIKLDNLFNGDKALGDNMNLFLNENWRELLKELQPTIEEVLAVAFSEIAQQFLNRVPLNQIIVE